MPQISKELTALEVRTIPAGTTKAVGGVRGLCIRKFSPKTGYFILRYRIKGVRHDFGLGAYPELSLAQARDLAREYRKMVDSGVDPIEDKAAREEEARRLKEEAEAAAAPITFRMVAEEWIEERVKRNHWKHNPRGEKSVRNVLEKHVYPVIGGKSIESLSAEDVLQCLEPIWQQKPSTAHKAKSHVRQICRWAVAKGKRQDKSNPASLEGELGVLMEPLKNGVKESKNYGACAVKDIPQLMKEIHAYGSMSARAFEFAVLTAARSQAVRLATWDEFDFERATWTIPVEHDKMKGPGRDRTVFLSKQALALLDALPYFGEGRTGLVFPSNQGGALSNNGLEMFLRGVHEKKLALDGIGWIDPVKSKIEGRPCKLTQHGTCRATFRTWAKDDLLGNNRRFDQEAVELCLLHSKNDGYKGAYDRARLEEERRLIMNAWGDYVCSRISPLRPWGLCVD